MTENNILALTTDYIDSLQRKAPANVISPSTGMHFGEQAKYVSWNFDRKKFPRVEILHLTDTHWGHVGCQVKRLCQYRDWILDSPNRFVLWGGDMIDAITVLSPGQPWENICGPSSQIYKFCELMLPIRHRILGYVSGNHEARGLKTFGDLGTLIASFLKIPYSSGRQLIDVYYGSHEPFQIDLWHGRGAARTKGARVMMLWNYVKDHPGANLYLTGHLHDCFVLPFSTEQRMHDKRGIRLIKNYAGMSSSFLETWGGYAETSGLAITDVIMLRTILEPSGKSEVTLR